MKNVIILLMIVVISLCSGNLFAASDAKGSHPIDIKEKKCLESKQGNTTIGIAMCISDAEKDWDTELNNTYKFIINAVDDREKSLLKTAQKKWLAYRDSEIAFMKQLYKRASGSAKTIDFAARKRELTKNRVLELNIYYKYLPRNTN